MMKPKTADELRAAIKGYIDYLESVGIVEKLENGGLRVAADQISFGVATAEDGRKGLVIIMRSTTTKLEMLFVVEEEALLSQIDRAVDEILSTNRVDVV